MGRIILPVNIIEIEKGNFHLMLDSKLHDGFNAKWIIDTGASKSVFDSNLEKYYKIVEDKDNSEILSTGIGIDEFETKTGIIKKIKFEDFSIRQFKVTLIDLTHINKLYEKYTSLKICGLLGSDFLMKNKAVIDYEKKNISISLNEH